MAVLISVVGSLHNYHIYSDVRILHLPKVIKFFGRFSSSETQICYNIDILDSLPNGTHEEKPKYWALYLDRLVQITLSVLVLSSQALL